MTLKGLFFMPNHLSAQKGDVVEVARKSVERKDKNNGRRTKQRRN